MSSQGWEGCFEQVSWHSSIDAAALISFLECIRHFVVINRHVSFGVWCIFDLVAVVGCLFVDDVWFWVPDEQC
jgi:hypothetical protein